MTRLRCFDRLLVLCLAVLATVYAAPAGAKETAAASPDREILVMVRHPPDHFRPNGDYGGGYGDALTRSARERLARRIARKYGVTFIDEYPMPMIAIDCFVMAVPDGRSTGAVAEQVSRDADVAWSQPVTLYTAHSRAVAQNDPLFAAQPAATAWHLSDLHRIATGKGITIAVIDSGIDATHPDLAGQLLVNRNFVLGQSAAAEAHGTGVAGIIAGRPDNHVGIVGIAPDARVLGLRACWQVKGSLAGKTVCDSLSVAKAVYFAIERRADVINLSISGPDDQLLAALLKIALERGAAIVAAFDEGRPDGGFPAAVPGVIAVSDSLLAPSRGRVYTAPGRDVPTTQPGGRWFLVNGSSYAAAHVSGLIALMRQRRRSAALTLVTQPHRGGEIDACATLARAAGPCDCACGSIRFARTGFGR
jgi:subtilisin family serine protease